MSRRGAGGAEGRQVLMCSVIWVNRQHGVDNKVIRSAVLLCWFLLRLKAVVIGKRNEKK